MLLLLVVVIIIITCMSDSRRGSGLDIGFNDHFNTQLVITSNYGAIANFKNLQFTRAHAKSFPVRSTFTSNCLVTASNNDYYSASGLKSSLNGGSLPTPIFLTTDSRPFNTNLLVFSPPPIY
jgi:hypothetical protein